ncbi:MAG: hypothetical protein JSV43_04740 [Methanobacteriota archaeon]|nr:MAG: hypothetical protein JSV43_04740 [Euryarchaeota archaeon]
MDEKKPIIRLMFAKVKEAFFDLSDEEKMEFMRKDRGNLDELGCKFEMIDLRWSTEEWQFVGIEEWPSIEALEKRAKFEKEELQGFRFAEMKTYVGTRESSAEYGKE